MTIARSSISGDVSVGALVAVPGISFKIWVLPRILLHLQLLSTASTFARVLEARFKQLF